jgi:hypothetical protein
MSDAPPRAVSRRAALGVLAIAACRPSNDARAPIEEPEDRWKIDPAVDLAPAAGLEWLVEARCRELAADPVTRAAIAEVVSDAGFRSFADRRGGIDLRAADELVVAGYRHARLALLRARFDRARVEAAATARATMAPKRVAERGVLWLSTTAGDRPQQTALLGDVLVGQEWGDPGPLQAAEYFAEGRLRRSLPALRAEPLRAVAEMLGPAPLRAFAPGPFEGAWAKGVAGLLGGATAVGASMRSSSGASAGRGVDLHVVILGGWGDDAAAAAERLRATYDLLVDDPLGRLMGLDTPLDGPRAAGDATALRLEVTVDAMALARGLHAATGATLDEILTS